MRASCFSQDANARTFAKCVSRKLGPPRTARTVSASQGDTSTTSLSCSQSRWHQKQPNQKPLLHHSRQRRPALSSLSGVHTSTTPPPDSNSSTPSSSFSFCPESFNSRTAFSSPASLSMLSSLGASIYQKSLTLLQLMHPYRIQLRQQCRTVRVDRFVAITGQPGEQRSVQRGLARKVRLFLSYLVLPC